LKQLNAKVTVEPFKEMMGTIRIGGQWLETSLVMHWNLEKKDHSWSKISQQGRCRSIGFLSKTKWIEVEQNKTKIFVLFKHDLHDREWIKGTELTYHCEKNGLRLVPQLGRVKFGGKTDFNLQFGE
jgi:hypothetical protein